jgi:hypothetical protein
MFTYAPTRKQHRGRSGAAPGPLFADRPISPLLYFYPDPISNRQSKTIKNRRNS